MPAAAIAPDARVFPPGVAACLCVDAAAGRMWTYDASAQNVIVSRSGWGSGRGGRRPPDSQEVGYSSRPAAQFVEGEQHRLPARAQGALTD